MPVALELAGEAVDSSTSFADGNVMVHQRSHTSASVEWDMDFAPTGGMQITSPEIAQLVGEIVNREGWSAYNALSILIESDPSTTQYIDAWAYDHDPNLAAKIVICHQAQGPPIATATPTLTPTFSPPTPTVPPSPGSKQGMNWLYSDTVPAQEITAAGAKAVHHWGYNANRALEAINAGLHYYPVQWGCSGGEASVNEAAIRSFIGTDPGKLKGLTWLAFNEPELQHQADCTPLQAAQAFHRLDEVLRSGGNPADPTAKLYCCGVVHTGLWTAYMGDFGAQYRATYGNDPPMDGVHIHLYNGPLNRLNWCRLRDNLDTFRGWQQSQYWLRDDTMIVSEWAVLSNAAEHPGDYQMMVGDCTPGCECDTMAKMWHVFEQRSWVEYHLWWTSYADASTGDPSEYWDSGNVFSDRYGSQLTDPVGLKYLSLSSGG
jgi:hypothetical protein